MVYSLAAHQCNVGSTAMLGPYKELVAIGKLNRYVALL